MAGLGEDTTAAAFHILEDPDFNVYIPEHVLTLAENYALVYMLLLIIHLPAATWTTPPGSWKASSRLAWKWSSPRPPSIVSRMSVTEVAEETPILVLWYAQTECRQSDCGVRGRSEQTCPGTVIRKADHSSEGQDRSETASPRYSPLAHPHSGRNARV